MPIRSLVILAVLASLVIGCASNTPFRTITLKQDRNAQGVEDDHCTVPASASFDQEKECAKHSIVHRYYKPEHDYYVAFVEFDDQGWFHDRKQLESLLRLLYQQDKSKKDEFLIIVYAHGWKHNADFCDNNARCFQRLLERFDVMERTNARLEKARPRKVVGVYVGWRGESLNVPFVHNITFWTRKAAAARVGDGGVTLLISQLDDFRDFKNPDREKQKTQLVVTGHSFGGQVIYSALSNRLVERATLIEREKDGKSIEYGIAKGVGDLVVLINPAFEGSLYEPLHHAATNRCYRATQRPVMLIVTSEADDATKNAFPLGRRVNTLLTRAGAHEGQREAIVKTVGHLDRYRTHTLALTGVDKSEVAEGEKKCGCPWLRPTSDFISEFEIEGPERGFLSRIYNSDLKTPIPGNSQQDKAEEGSFFNSESKKTMEFQYGDDLRLRRETEAGEYTPNYPYLVVSTTREIMPDHNRFYDENFTDFLRRFYLRHIRERINFRQDCFKDVPACVKTDITPCQRSCRRKDRDRSSCSGRRGLVTGGHPSGEN